MSDLNFINEMKNKAIAGECLSKNEALNLAKTSDLDALLNTANEIRQICCGDEFNFCSIINARSGKCSEDCKYCAQSAHFKTGCETYSLLDMAPVLQMAQKNEKAKVHRFSLVASGRGISENDKDMPKIEQIYRALREQTNLHLCASFGLASVQALQKLKDSGVKTYHHNLETSRRFYPRICTTHTYDDRVQTIKNCHAVGLDVCSGGIFGLGESVEDRIDMAFELRELGVSSVPINILMPISGTPLQNCAPLSEEEILRSIAVYRFILPRVYLRFAGGRIKLGKSIEKALNSGVNSAITGDFLTTTGDSISGDMALVSALGFRI
ncbi:biotin synthase BioB [Campylobacter sp. JMF_06 NA1]|uniref:biotin synthase BioB n=1 Tax=Campylobacter sp. JMF_06 NA1 TaxID=2983823 RepID=UPI0022E9CB09|nr:biotin synthase BioB [Campylobacter sp. JMF_06 NA1]MDA3078389.1 biotin synthase BioB [Campylobacter sp. JMF_06 NA1]